MEEAMLMSLKGYWMTLVAKGKDGRVLEGCDATA